MSDCVTYDDDGNLDEVAREDASVHLERLNDNPYTNEDAERYGVCLVNRSKAMDSCAHILAPGGVLLWLDQVRPTAKRIHWEQLGVMLVDISGNRRVRAVFMYRRAG